MTTNSKTKKKATRKPDSPKSYTTRARAIDAQMARSEVKDVLDLTLAAKRRRLEAEAVHDLIRMGTSDFITHILTDVIERAGRSQNLPTPTYAEDATETKAQAIEKIEQILICARNFQWRTEPNTRAALAEHIAAIMTNPETPSGLYNAVGEEVTDWSTDYCNEYSNTPAYIEQCLTSYLKKEEKRKGGAS